jgi:hypothetical protein
VTAAIEIATTAAMVEEVFFTTILLDRIENET